MKYARQWAMPNKNTFEIAPIRSLIGRYLTGVSVDPFARNGKLATITNDLNTNTTAEYHMQATEFLHMLSDRGVMADVVLLDPPYSPRQISECYKDAGITCGMTDTQNSVLYANVRKAVRKISKTGTIVMSFGWNSCGMGKHFEMLELLLVAHGGAHNDTICLVEQQLPSLV